MITRWQYCLSVAMITSWHYCISIEMVTGCVIKGEVLVEKLFSSFFNPLISLYIYYDQYEKILKKTKIIFSPRFVSMEMAAIFDFRAFTKVHITLKLLLQMQ